MTHTTLRRLTPLAARPRRSSLPPRRCAEPPPASRRRPPIWTRSKCTASTSRSPPRSKYTEPLLDTPQTITVVTSEVMDQQNLLGLRDVLSTLPGITFGAGEGGGGYGDSINLRGFNANSDITTDGVRDSAQYTRTDTFNLECDRTGQRRQLGVLRRGLGRRQHQPGQQGRARGRLHRRAGRRRHRQLRPRHRRQQHRLRQRHRLPHQRDGPPERRAGPRRTRPSSAGASRRRSPSAWARDTRFTLSYFHQSDDNIPQYGVPYFSAFGGPLPGVDPSNYYGYHNIDTQEIDVDMLTGVFEHDFSDAHDAAQPGALPAGRPAQRRRCAAGHLVPGQRHQPGHRRGLRRVRPDTLPAQRPARQLARHQQRASPSARPT